MAKRKRTRTKFGKQVFDSIGELQQYLFDILQEKKTARPNSTPTLRKIPREWKLTDGTKVSIGTPETGYSGIQSPSDIQVYRFGDVAPVSKTRQALRNIPPDLKYFIKEWYGPEILKLYEEWVKGGKDRLKIIRREIIDELQNRGANKETLQVTDSHLLNVGQEGRRVPVKRTRGYDPFQGATSGWDPSGRVTIQPKAPPAVGGSLRPPYANQSFLEGLIDNIKRGASPAAALDEIRELGLPTSWLEDFYNMMLLRKNAQGELSDLIFMQPDLPNKDVADLVSGRKTASQIVIERLDREWYERASRDFRSTIAKLESLPKEMREDFADSRYEFEIAQKTKGDVLQRKGGQEFPGEEVFRGDTLRANIDDISVTPDPYAEAGLLQDMPYEPEGIFLTDDELRDMTKWEASINQTDSASKGYDIGLDTPTTDPSLYDIDELPSRRAGIRPTVKGLAIGGLTIGGLASTIAGEAGYAGLNPETGYHAGVLASGEGDISNVKGAAAGAGKAFGWGMGFNLASKALMRGGAAKTAGKFVPFLGTPLLLWGIYETADAFTKGYTGKGITERITDIDYGAILDDVFAPQNSQFQKRRPKREVAISQASL